MDGDVSTFPSLIFGLFRYLLRNRCARPSPVLDPAIGQLSPGRLYRIRDQPGGPKAPNNGCSDAGLVPMADASSERPY